MSRPKYQVFILAFTAFMSVLYVLVGLFFTFSELIAKMMNPPYNKVLGIALIVYGCFRGYRVYQKFKNEDEEL